jgi:hypothetical protein
VVPKDNAEAEKDIIKTGKEEEASMSRIPRRNNTARPSIAHPSQHPTPRHLVLLVLLLPLCPFPNLNLSILPRTNQRPHLIPHSHIALTTPMLMYCRRIRTRKGYRRESERGDRARMIVYESNAMEGCCYSSGGRCWVDGYGDHVWHDVTRLRGMCWLYATGNLQLVDIISSLSSKLQSLTARCFSASIQLLDVKTEIT